MVQQNERLTEVEALKLEHFDKIVATVYDLETGFEDAHLPHVKTILGEYSDQLGALYDIQADTSVEDYVDNQLSLFNDDDFEAEEDLYADPTVQALLEENDEILGAEED